MSVLKELDSVRSSSRERHSSMTSNDQEEIRNIFSDPENNWSFTAGTNICNRQYWSGGLSGEGDFIVLCDLPVQTNTEVLVDLSR